MTRFSHDPAPPDTRRRLGWPMILRALADRTRTAVGREGAEGLAPLPDREAVLGRLRRIGAMRELHRLGESLPLAGVPDVRPHVTHAGKEGLLEGPALREVAALTRAASETAALLGRFPEALGELRARWPELGGLSGLAGRIETAIAPDGEVSDAASPALAEARARVRGLHERLRRQAEGLVASAQWRDALQEAYFTVRGDRYVLPVKAAFRYQVGGIVHNVSNTGQTVFVEPPALVEAGNELALATAEVAEEIRRVLQGLTAAVRDAGDRILADLQALGALDLLEAMARLAGDLDATVPEVPAAAEETAFVLRGLRHPLLVLQGKRVVPNDVVPEATARCLVVSGPNAGGKTVTVTAVALCALLVRHGLPVPAEDGSVVPLYPVVRAVVGDEQDLERDLSSFSAHLQELRRVLEDAGAGALVLVDEICADTDPREGAALAVAVLEALLDQGARVLVTTHLAALKALAATDTRFLAAAVGFDPERMTPTYRLRLHASAGSSALEVASRVGLPAEVVEAARRHLSGDEGSMANALRDLARAQAEAGAEADRLREAQAELARAQAALAQTRADLEAEKRRLREEAQAALLEDIEAARRQVKQTIADLQAQPRMRKAGEVDRQLEEMAKAARAAVARQQEASEPATGDLRPGTFVRVPSLGDKDAEVLEVGTHDALVALGALKTRVPLDHLVPLHRPPRAQPARRMATSKAEKLARAERARGGPVNEGPPETIDLRGMRVDEALAELTRRLDRLFAEGALRAVVIHGHGTGALKQAVRDFLAGAPYATGIRPGDRHEGGDGVTVVEMG